MAEIRKKAQSEKGKSRIIIIDDHPIVRQGLSQLINQEPDLQVVGQAGSSTEALEVIGSSRPDIIILDISLGNENGLSLIETINAQCGGVPVLVLSMHDESLFAERVLRVGAKGYIMKQEAPERVILAIRQVLAGKVYLGEKMGEQIIEKLVGGKTTKVVSPIESLSNRELQVFQSLGQGSSTRQIAEKLHLSVKTIETYYEHIKKKMHLKSVREVLMHAIQWSQQPEKGKP